MYVNVAVLKETQPHERRVALVPSVVGKLTKLGAKLHMQSGAGDAGSLVDAAFKDVTFTGNRHALVKDADVVLAVQPPALDVRPSPIFKYCPSSLGRKLASGRLTIRRPKRPSSRS